MAAQHPTWKILTLWGIILIPLTWAVACTVAESLRLISAPWVLVAFFAYKVSARQAISS